MDDDFEVTEENLQFIVSTFYFRNADGADFFQEISLYSKCIHSVLMGSVNNGVNIVDLLDEIAHRFSAILSLKIYNFACPCLVEFDIADALLYSSLKWNLGNLEPTEAIEILALSKSGLEKYFGKPIDLIEDYYFSRFSKARPFFFFQSGFEKMNNALAVSETFYFWRREDFLLLDESLFSSLYEVKFGLLTSNDFVNLYPFFLKTQVYDRKKEKVATFYVDPIRVIDDKIVLYPGEHYVIGGDSLLISKYGLICISVSSEVEFDVVYTEFGRIGANAESSFRILDVTLLRTAP